MKRGAKPILSEEESQWAYEKWCEGYTIQQIADELNFPSQSFFGKYFKKNIGVSPKEYRNTRNI